MGKELSSQSFIGWLGEEKYKKMVNFILHYLADIDIPVKRYVISVRCLSRFCSNGESMPLEVLLLSSAME